MISNKDRQKVEKFLPYEEKWHFLRELVRELILQDMLSEFPEVVRKIQEDPVFCADVILGKPVESLYWYEKDLMRAIWRYKTVLVEKGRQIGITYTCGLASGCWALTRAENIVLNISRNLDQAQEMYNYTKEFMLQDEEIAEKFLVKNPAATRMILRNKSVVRAMGCRIPYADNIRGKRAHLYFLDEVILIYNKMFDSIEPITTWTKGHRVYITTAGQQDCYFFKLKLMIEKGLIPSAKLFVLPACKEREDGTLYDPICPVLTIEELEQKRRERGKLRFGREYLCKWIGAANQMFPGFKTYDYQKPKESSKPCYGGIDVGRVQNPTVFILLGYQGKNQPYRLVYCRAWYGKPFEVVANSILNVSKHFNIQKIVLDQQGMGQGLLEKLQEKGLSIEGRKWTKEKKNQDMFALQGALCDEEKIIVPSSEEQLVFELKGYTYEPKEGSNLFDFDCIESDDHVDALAFAYYAAKEGEPRSALARAW